MSELTPIRLRIVDKNGVAVEGAFISVLHSSVAYPEIALISDQRGKVQIHLPAGNYLIGIDAPGKQPYEVAIDNTRGTLITRETLVTLTDK